MNASISGDPMVLEHRVDVIQGSRLRYCRNNLYLIDKSARK